jgi:hypothetical protein
MVRKKTFRWVGIERCQSRIKTEARRAIGTQDSVRLSHVYVEVRVVLRRGDSPIHMNSFTPMQISGTPLPCCMEALRGVS